MKEILYTLTENNTRNVIISEKSLSQFAFKCFKLISETDPSLSQLNDHKVRMQKNTDRYKIYDENKYTFTGLFIAVTKEEVIKLNTVSNSDKASRKRWFEDEFHLGDEVVFLSTQWYNDIDDPKLNKKQLRYSELVKLLNVYYTEQYTCEHKSVELPIIQAIYFGAPGTGKSYTIKELLKKEYNIDEDKDVNTDRLFRTTFHPETDYSSFVGCYRPLKDKKSGSITYDFNPEVFTDAYKRAWEEYNKNNNNPEQVFLVIEEINRGNCAQIFGDLFQLLDRKENGFSEYKIRTDKALTQYLKGLKIKCLLNDCLCFPPNLNIIATMNTSDQSLFPMDSAFKRRWDWRCVPTLVPKDKEKTLTYKVCPDVKTFDDKAIDTGDYTYSWNEFLEKINRLIQLTTKSDDKKLGFWFVKTPKGNNTISISNFVAKVVFYLWNDVFKDVGSKESNPFAIKGTKDIMTYSQFFEINASDGQIVENIGVLHTFMKNVGVVPEHISSTQNP